MIFPQTHEGVQTFPLHSHTLTPNPKLQAVPRASGTLGGERQGLGLSMYNACGPTGGTTFAG